ncbi:phosphatase PAP2 family protein [Demequina sp. SYSU T00192]|uniref:Phosphatase PAP2 family protein n=1 Tax=Demequina litoralis TaxID=3051660 RepID=A0ABT8GA53_9MICO|nr:phosphatase PAP2 family protein [Demequina sp. SYSU T00192]MDN4475579.1 phosphatase PAP2 family protein [Demequina sp. SYSU T00192]
MGRGPGATAPSPRDVPGGLARRVLLPTALLWAAVVGVGFLLAEVPENGVNERLVELRIPALDTVTAFVSGSASTMVVIATALVVAALVWWTSRQWWLATVPLVALALEAAVFLTSSAVVGRDRPDVDQLDHAPPTSSFPSGHTGASTAVYVSFALLATRIRHGALRVTVIVVCALMPVAVALSRVYRGMHHPTDVVAGLAVGATCALIAWTWMPDGARASSDAQAPRGVETDLTRR